MASDDNGVGYGKPPRQHRFVKGQSGNPRGRPPRSKNIDTLIDRELDQRISLKEGGREITLPKRQAIVKRLVNAALTGNPRAIEYLVKYCKEHGAADPFVITAEDQRTFDEAMRRRAAAEDAPS